MSKVKVARDVLIIESKNIANLANSLDDTFSKAIDIILSVKGRVVVTGMGKSGLIARKICSTLASTGTPASYVHPAEASHGDLGMITTEDVVLALSYSGETKELSDIISHSKRIGIPLISITSNRESTLSQASSVTLILSIDREACPHDLAPTTSTTSMLALGDAIAVTLINEKKFSEIDYKYLHPGGSLGLRLLKVSEVMRPVSELPIIELSQSASEVVKRISDKNFGCVGVVDEEGNLKGIITDGDLRRSISKDFMSKKATDIMTRNPIVANLNEFAATKVGLMNQKQITAIFVIEGQKPIELLRLHDCLRLGLK